MAFSCSSRPPRPWFGLTLPGNATYHSLLHTPVSVGFGKYTMAQDLHHFINDGLMCIFFFLVGLEIKREILTGELSSVKRAALPLAAALGGVVVPALSMLP